MNITLLLKGFAVGLVMAVPVGPVGMLCAQRTLIRGKIHGLVCGFGAATADVIYGTIAVFGLTLISNFLTEHYLLFRLFGGIFICLLGIKALTLKRRKESRLTEKLHHFNNYGSTLLIALSNPITLIISAGTFAALGIVGTNRRFADASELVVGVFLGSMFWWILLSFSIGVFHRKVSEGTLDLFARIFGGILTTVGIVIAVTAVV